MRVSWCGVMAGLIGLTTLTGGAQAHVEIRVDVASQTMRVESDTGESYVWPVSTARKGFSTPHGTYGVKSLERMHYSRKYDNSPMPHSIFFSGGYAIHGTYETRSLGRAASHGCIRLAPGHAAELYRMVQAEGARITITGAPARDVETAGVEGHRRYRTAQAARRGDDQVPLFEEMPATGAEDGGADDLFYPQY